jgi:predicted alpha/beta superfamily hydrolase
LARLAGTGGLAYHVQRFAAHRRGMRERCDVTTDWLDYADYVGGRQHTVSGTVKVSPQLWSPQLHNRRDILVYLPPAYHQAQRRFPVLYMHDGQNLFDQATSYAGEWRADETLEALDKEGIAAIVVGVPNAGERRMFEYGPFHHNEQAGDADAYLAFLADTLKPIIDRDFRTLPQREHTGLLGSSMGGLVSLYGFFHRPETFGLVGAMSPSLWFGGGAIFDDVAAAPRVPGRIYLDMGTLEGPLPRGRARVRPLVRRMLADARRMDELLRAKGYVPGRDLLFVEDAGGQHNEADWARRLPDALRFLLGAQSGV